MFLIEYLRKYNFNRDLIRMLTDLGLKDTSIKFEFETDLLNEIANLQEKTKNLTRARKRYYGMDMLLEELKNLPKEKNSIIRIASFSNDNYVGRLYRTKQKGVGLFIVEKGIKLETPPFWDGTIEMLLKYNGK